MRFKKRRIKLHGYNVTVNEDNDDLDAMVKHVQKEKLPLLTPKGMVSDIVLEVGDIVRGQMEVVNDFDQFKTTVRKQLFLYCSVPWCPHFLREMIYHCSISYHLLSTYSMENVLHQTSAEIQRTLEGPSVECAR